MYSIDFTYESDANGDWTNIDRFVISDSLIICVNRYSNLNNVDTMLDHLPLCVYINLPINIVYVHDVRQFIPKLKWTTVNDGMLIDHICTLDMSLENIVLLEATIHCTNTSHGPLIQKFHDKIIAALHKTAKVLILFKTPNFHWQTTQITSQLWRSKHDKFCFRIIDL